MTSKTEPTLAITQSPASPSVPSPSAAHLSHPKLLFNPDNEEEIYTDYPALCVVPNGQVDTATAPSSPDPTNSDRNPQPNDNSPEKSAAHGHIDIPSVPSSQEDEYSQSQRLYDGEGLHCIVKQQQQPQSTLETPHETPTFAANFTAVTAASSALRDRVTKRLFGDVDNTDMPSSMRPKNDGHISVTKTSPTKLSPSSRAQAEGQNVAATKSEMPTSKQEPTTHPYYTQSFLFILDYVCKRYSHILHADDRYLLGLFTKRAGNPLSCNAINLFVRMYTRKHFQWLAVPALADNYDIEQSEMNTIIEELCRNGIIVSCKHAIADVNTAHIEWIKTQFAIRLLNAINNDQLKAIVQSLSLEEQKKLKSMKKKDKKLEHLKEIIRDEIGRCKSKHDQNVHGQKEQKQTNKQKSKIKSPPVVKKRRRSSEPKFRQMTISGVTQAMRLTSSILAVTDNYVSIPSNTIASLKRIYFLFFLHDGHKSPNVTLANTNKVKFAEYEVHHSPQLIYPSARAYNDYEDAVSTNEEIQTAIAEKRWTDADTFGAKAFQKLEEFDNFCTSSSSTTLNLQQRDTDKQRQQSPNELSLSERQYKEEIRTQLGHPFFKQYCSMWIYSAACMHSVAALERLKDYEAASNRLQLVLQAGYLSRRRKGKCFNRLTINLTKHLNRSEDALKVIAAGLEKVDLNFGDQLELANRGLAIFNRLNPSNKRKKFSCSDANEDVEICGPDTPACIKNVLVENSGVEIKIRKVFGIAQNKIIRETLKSLDAIENPFERFIAENEYNQRESVDLSAVNEEDLKYGKSKFEGFDEDRDGDGKTDISVEEYCLQCYSKHEGWDGVHDECRWMPFVYTLLMWESGIFKNVNDVFLTPYQDKPLDLYTEAFYESRKLAIDERIVEIAALSEDDLYNEIVRRYDNYHGIKAVGCYWNSTTYTKELLGGIAKGLGSAAISNSCRLMSEDYSYWCSGYPDLTLWKHDEQKNSWECKLVEVKSARDYLSEKQRSQISAFVKHGAKCEVCKVVERVTANNHDQLQWGTASVENLKTVSKTENTSNLTTVKKPRIAS